MESRGVEISRCHLVFPATTEVMRDLPDSMRPKKNGVDSDFPAVEMSCRLKEMIFSILFQGDDRNKSVMQFTRNKPDASAQYGSGEKGRDRLTVVCNRNRTITVIEVLAVIDSDGCANGSKEVGNTDRI